MKLQILSDLHFEFYYSGSEIDNFIKKIVNTDTDIIIIAGDLSRGKDVVYHLNNIWFRFHDTPLLHLSTRIF